MAADREQFLAHLDRVVGSPADPAQTARRMARVADLGGPRESPR